MIYLKTQHTLTVQMAMFTNYTDIKSNGRSSMRILHVIGEIDPKLGGVGQAVRSMIGALAAMGIHNETVSLDAPTAPFIKSEPFAIHATGPGKGPWFYNANLYKWLTENLFQYDKVIIHGLWRYHAYAVSKAWHHLKKNAALNSKVLPQVYIMPHGMLDPYFQNAKTRKLKAIRNNLYWRFIEKNVVNNAAGLLFTCEEELRLARIPFQPYSPKSEKVVGLGVENPPAFAESMKHALQEKCKGLNGAPYLLFLSRIHEKKGVDLLIQAYAALVENSNGEIPFKLVIAGPGLDTPYGEKIKSLAATVRNAAENIFFPGMLTGDAKYGAFYGAEAFILPSHQENFGIAVVEALACGKPVLISNQVNIWREIEASGAGIVADNTLEGTSALMKQWVSLSSIEKKEKGMQAVDCYKKYFALTPAAQRLLSALGS
ncbi:MAG: glycosyltransferase [Chitinophagaceae bacterium]